MTSSATHILGKRRVGAALATKPKKLWRVGDLVRFSGLTRQTIHNYCLFGLLEEVECTDGGHRLYDDTVFRRLERIERLKARGKRLREIAALLSRKRAR